MRISIVDLTPYSAIPEPHDSQNSRMRLVPDPLSPSCAFVWPLVIANASLGTLAVIPFSEPVNFCLAKSVPKLIVLPRRNVVAHLAVFAMTDAHASVLFFAVDIIADGAAVTSTRVFRHFVRENLQCLTCRSKQLIFSMEDHDITTYVAPLPSPSQY